MHTDRKATKPMSIATLVTKEDADLARLKGIISGTPYFINFGQREKTYKKILEESKPFGHGAYHKTRSIAKRNLSFVILCT